MGCKGSKATGVEPIGSPVPVSTTPGSPASLFDLEQDAEKKVVAQTIFREIPTSAVAEPLKEDYKLENAFTKHTEFGINTASQKYFYSLLQQKTRFPSKFILFDTQSKIRANSDSLKLSICPWTINPPKLEEDVAPYIAKVKEQVLVTGATVLLFSPLAKLVEDDNLKAFVTRVLIPAEVPLDKVIALEGSFHDFCNKYPHCYCNSDVTLPGPTVLLERPKTGFCLLQGDLKCVRGGLEAVVDIHQVQALLNLSGIPLDGTSCAQTFKAGCIDMTPTDHESRGVFYKEAVYKLVELSKFGAPVLVVDQTGEKESIAVCAIYLTVLGFPADKVVEEITKLRGEPKQCETLFDSVLVSALKVIESGGQADGVEKAIALFPPWADEQ